MDIYVIVNCLLPIFAAISCFMKPVFSRKYCSAHPFAPKCPPGNIIIATRAKYGRMEMGECVSTEMGLGCGGDVMSIVDNLCSGRENCTLQIPHTAMNKLSNCKSYFTQYLDAEYACLRAVTPSRKKCTSSVVVDATSQDGVLASVTSQQTGCGTTGAPWILEAAPGQRLSLTLLDFTLSNNTNKQGSYSQCAHKYGHVIDLESETTEFICGSQGNRRYEQVILSRSHRVQVTFDDKTVRNRTFIVQFKALGCPNLVRPAHAWMKREGDHVTIGCEETRQQWHLTCNTNKWQGVIGNCSQYLAKPSLARTTDGVKPFLQSGGAALMVISIAMILCALIIITGVICLRRISIEEKRRCVQYQYPILRRHGDGLYHIKPSSEDYKDTSIAYSDSNTYSRNEYTHIWDQNCLDDSRSEMSLPPPPPHTTPCHVTGTGAENGVDRVGLSGGRSSCGSSGIGISGQLSITDYFLQDNEPFHEDIVNLSDDSCNIHRSHREFHKT